MGSAWAGGRARTWAFLCLEGVLSPGRWLSPSRSCWVSDTLGTAGENSRGGRGPPPGPCGAGRGGRGSDVEQSSGAASRPVGSVLLFPTLAGPAWLCPELTVQVEVWASPHFPSPGDSSWALLPPAPSAAPCTLCGQIAGAGGGKALPSDHPSPVPGRRLCPVLKCPEGEDGSS